MRFPMVQSDLKPNDMRQRDLENSCFRVAVVIPVYRAEQYIAEAIRSALSQPETAEVILVEDGSPDNSLVVCEVLTATDSRIQLYRHPNGENRGAGASRNLGILKSTCDYIAFLDADDYFLPNRFAVTKSVFETDKSVDGVYEAIGTHFQTQEAQERWERLGRGGLSISTMPSGISPSFLLEKLLNGPNFSIIGLTVSRALLVRTGLFDETLRLHQDSVMIWKMAAIGKLVPGELAEPVAMCRVHARNRSSAERPMTEIYYSKIRAYGTLWQWSCLYVDRATEQMILSALLDQAMYKLCIDRQSPVWMRGLQKRLRLLRLSLSHPSVLRRRQYWRRFLPGFRFWLARFSRNS